VYYFVHVVEIPLRIYAHSPSFFRCTFFVHCAKRGTSYLTRSTWFYFVYYFVHVVEIPLRIYARSPSFVEEFLRCQKITSYSAHFPNFRKKRASFLRRFLLIYHFVHVVEIPLRIYARSPSFFRCTFFVHRAKISFCICASYPSFG
jgi:hypothetical protein